MTEATHSRYYILDSGNPNRMLLYPPPNPSLKDRWMSGRRFIKPPAEPVVATIQPGYEKSELVPYFDAARLMSTVMHDVLRSAGVDNLDVYEAEIRSEDGAIVHRGYKAFNIIGLVQAADLKQTVFNDPPGSRVIDASIEHLIIDDAKVGDLLMFRLAEFVGAVIVHEKVRVAVEANQIPDVVFREPHEFVS
jgi:hypothetical protein